MGGLGTVLGLDETGWIRVKWDRTGETYSYRTAALGGTDLVRASSTGEDGDDDDDGGGDDDDGDDDGGNDDDDGDDDRDDRATTLSAISCLREVKCDHGAGHGANDEACGREYRDERHAPVA